MPEANTKRVLVISNLFHSSPRIPRILKQLSSLGWSPTVVTPKIEAGAEKVFNAPPHELGRLGVEVVEAGKGRPYDSVKEEGGMPAYAGFGKRLSERMERQGGGRMSRLLDKYYWRFYATLNYPDPERRWKADAIDAADRLLERGRYDLLLSSSSPIITHMVCDELKRRHGVPWIAEYRDLWTLNHNYHLGPIMHVFDRRLELRTMRNADALVTVTDDLAEKLRGMFPGMQVMSIPTGVDRDEMPPSVPLTKTFTMTYTGQFYRDGQDPNKVLDCVSELIEERAVERKRVRIRFYGPFSDSLQRYAEQKGLGDILQQHGVVTRRESMLRQMESQVLLFMNWELPDKGTTSLKLVEYFFAGRPVLLSGGFGDNLMAKQVEGTGTGRVAVSREEIKAAILAYYNEYMQRGEASFRGKADEIEKFDARHTASAYVELMNAVVRKAPVRRAV